MVRWIKVEIAIVEGTDFGVWDGRTIAEHRVLLPLTAVDDDRLRDELSQAAGDLVRSTQRIVPPPQDEPA